MLRKFVNSLIAAFLLAGCGNSAAAAVQTTAGAAESAASSAQVTAEAVNNEDEEASAQAAEAVKDLGLTDEIQAVEPQVIQGLMFFDEGLVTGSSLYLSGNKKADLVGVFRTSDADKTTEALKTYLTTLKDQMETYNPSESFKIDNAVIQSNDKEVVMIVAEDIEAAKKEAEKLLAE